MANHVSSYLKVDMISPEGQKVWDEFVVGRLDAARSREESEYAEVHLGNFFVDNDSDINWDLMQEKVGAKWAYATDWDECGIAMYSAWSPVGEFAREVVEEIAKVDPEVSLVLTYEDEFPNFIGVAEYTEHGETDDNCIEWDEFLQWMIGRNDDLKELWDEDAEDWKEDKEEEANDILCDIQWEEIHEWQNQYV